MAPKVEKVLPDTFVLGEAPHWDADTQSLYFVDVFAHHIHKYVPSTNKHNKANIGKHVSFIIPVKGKTDQFVIASERELLLISWDGKSETVSIVKKLYELEENTKGTFNDGKCDPSGRLWTGTGAWENNEIQDEQGNFYSFQNDKITKHLTKIGLSNGLAFDAKAKKLYYIDTIKSTLDQFDFDITSGTISNGKPIFTLREKRGFGENGLDGMTIDTDGNLWVAVFNDSRIIKIDPRKPNTIVETIQIPAKEVTSVNFGGPNLDELYVTSGKLPIKDVTPSSPEDGGLFKVTGLNAKGLPGVGFVL